MRWEEIWMLDRFSGASESTIDGVPSAGGVPEAGSLRIIHAIQEIIASQSPNSVTIVDGTPNTIVSLRTIPRKGSENTATPIPKSRTWRWRYVEASIFMITGSQLR